MGISIVTVRVSEKPSAGMVRLVTERDTTSAGRYSSASTYKVMDTGKLPVPLAGTFPSRKDRLAEFPAITYPRSSSWTVAAWVAVSAWSLTGTKITTGYAATSYAYNTLDVNDYSQGSNNYPRRPRTTTEKVGGTVVRKKYRAFINLGGEIWNDEQTVKLYSSQEAAIEELCSDPSNGYGNSNNLRTITEYYGSELRDYLVVPPRIKSITYPDGRKDSYTHVKGTFSPGTPSTGTPGTFTPNGENGTGTDIRTVIVHGSTTHETGISGKTTVEFVIENEVGQRLQRSVYVNPVDLDEPESTQLIEWTEWAYDAQGRLTDSFSSNKKHAEMAWQDCCHASTTVDETGIETDTEYDAMGRRKSVTKVGLTGVIGDITTSYDYEGISGGGYKETTTTSGGSLSLATRVEYDIAGRIAKTVDQSGLETGYTYGTGTGGGKTVTRTFQDSTTETTEYYRDGQLKSVTGSAVVSKYYDYWVDNDGWRWTRVALGYDAPGGTNPTNTAIVTDTAVNRLDQTVKTIEYFGTGANDWLATRNYYNTNGQLERIEKTTSAGKFMADTIYEYNEMGEVVRMGLDVDGSGLAAESTDRITDTDRLFEQDESDNWWLVTTTKTYPTDSADNTITINTRKRRLTGWGTGTLVEEEVSLDASGNATTTTVEIDRANKLVTRKIKHPDVTASNTYEQIVTSNGLLTSGKNKSGLESTYVYDDLARRETATDPRGNTTTTTYVTDTIQGAKGKVLSVEDASGNKTTYSYYSNSGRVETITTGDGSSQQGIQRFAYTDRGEPKQVWGGTPYPVEYGYDVWGRKTSMKTYQTGSNWASETWPGGSETPDTTTWVYGTNGLKKWLTEKQFADHASSPPRNIEYTYKADGSIATRTWSRKYNSSDRIVTTYSYDDDTKDLTGISYTDGNATPNVTYAYHRTGKLKTVADAVGTRTFLYDSAINLDQEIIDGSSGGLYSKVVARKYETSGVEGRPTGFQVGTCTSWDNGRCTTLNVDYDTTYAYDTLGRLERVLGPGLNSTNGVKYERLENQSQVNTSDAVEYILYKDSSDDDVATTRRPYVANRDLLAYVENKVGETTVSKYSFLDSQGQPLLDTLGRRKSVIMTGSAFSCFGEHHWDYGYNVRNELTTADRKDMSENGLLPGDYDYTYDPIGNRVFSNLQNQQNQMTYTRNNVNQYTGTTYPTESFSYDSDGNLTADGKYSYTWDAENRLAAVGPVGTAAVNDRKLQFKYDYLGRRVEKIYSIYKATGWSEQTHQRFVYDDWNAVLVLDGNDSNNVKQKYTWGLDLSGQSGKTDISGLHGAGGIGGLLAVVETSGTNAGTYWFTYDGNGNVGQVLKVPTSGSITIAAKYEFDPYGNMLSSLGDYATANPFRFSTKWLDLELASWTTSGAVGNTGLYYYGYRYYSPRLGRWISRDPIEEKGGLGLYAFVENRPVMRFDWLGLACQSGQREVCTIQGPITHWECECVPINPPPPRGPGCGCRSCRAWTNAVVVGHTWIECDDGTKLDFAPDWLKGKAGTTQNLATTCTDITTTYGEALKGCECSKKKDCMKQEMQKIKDTWTWPWDGTCIGAKNQVLDACGLGDGWEH